jgi:hypothetical protein
VIVRFDDGLLGQVLHWDPARCRSRTAGASARLPHADAYLRQIDRLPLERAQRIRRSSTSTAHVDDPARSAFRRL